MTEIAKRLRNHIAVWFAEEAAAYRRVLSNPPYSTGQAAVGLAHGEALVRQFEGFAETLRQAADLIEAASETAGGAE